MAATTPPTGGADTLAPSPSTTEPKKTSGEQPVIGKGQRPVDPELLQVLGAAYKASKRDEEGYTPLAELGQRAKAVSSFAARNYGYTRLSELIRAVPNFEVKSDDEGLLLVKRLR